MNKFKKRLQRKLIQEDRLKLFDKDCYQEKFVDGSWFIKNWDGGREVWQVSKYSVESYNRYKNGGYTYREVKTQNTFVKNLFN